MTGKRSVEELREAAGDLHHGLRQERARGDADALAHVQVRAEEAGASPEDIASIRRGYLKIARDLLDEQAPRRRRARWRPFGRKAQDILPGGEAPKQLAPGK